MSDDDDDDGQGVACLCEGKMVVEHGVGMVRVVVYYCVLVYGVSSPRSGSLI
jgi:hypothetical protein